MVTESILVDEMEYEQSFHTAVEKSHSNGTMTPRAAGCALITIIQILKYSAPLHTAKENISPRGNSWLRLVWTFYCEGILITIHV